MHQAVSRVVASWLRNPFAENAAAALRLLVGHQCVCTKMATHKSMHLRSCQPLPLQARHLLPSARTIGCRDALLLLCCADSLLDWEELPGDQKDGGDANGNSLFSRCECGVQALHFV